MKPLRLLPFFWIPRCDSTCRCHRARQRALGSELADINFILKLLRLESKALCCLKRHRQSYAHPIVTHVVALGGMDMWIKQNKLDFR